MNRASFSALQYLLKLSYSIDSAEQERAAVELASLVENTEFPSVSFGPVAHALCHLLSSNNRTVTCFSARALKILVTDDSLRVQVGTTGVSRVVIDAIKRWEDEVLCVRELLGILQTLCWDRQGVQYFLTVPDVLTYLIRYMKASDDEVSVLALCTLANMLYYADSMSGALEDSNIRFELNKAMPILLRIVRMTGHRSIRFYSMAAVANASAHPIFSKVLIDHDAIEICEDQERLGKNNSSGFGTKLVEVAHSANVSLRSMQDLESVESGVERRETDRSSLSGVSEKYHFKWGKEPVMRISLEYPSKRQANDVVIALLVWGSILMWTFMPAFSS